MSYKTILAVLQNTSDTQRVLDCAVSLASRFSAHLIGFHAESTPLPYVTPMGFPDTEFITISEKVGEKRSAEIRALFETRMAAEGVSSNFRSVHNMSGDSAVSALSIARTCDLIII